MKFIFADSLDLVDPNFNFLSDRHSSTRRPYWDDVYPHEIFGYAPYDGILVSRGIVGDHKVRGKYTEPQALRFRREGVRKFLRLEAENLKYLDIFGDCGAFTYVKEDVPPYTPSDTASFYDDCGFTHGCSVDHIIFDFDDSMTDKGALTEAKRRFDITQENAREFLKETHHFSNKFTPLGVVQGWSPSSMAIAAKNLYKMGYKYLAIGGMVPLKSAQIKRALSKIREAIPLDINIHILGFAKAEEIETFIDFNITSFDTTSPLIRAFKDSRSNYFLPDQSGKLKYYSAIRVPQAIENSQLKKVVKKGIFRSEELISLEKQSLDILRLFDRGEADIEQTLNTVMEYSSPLIFERPYEDVKHNRQLKILRERYYKTLHDRPWKQCKCFICSQISIEVILFRANNRNRRRGFHNLNVYNSLIKNIEHIGKKNVEDKDLFSSNCPSKQ